MDYPDRFYFSPDPVKIMLEEGRTYPRLGMVRNERKAAVLGLLLRDGSVTTRDLVHRWDLSYSGAQASLEGYRRHSLLTRQREPTPGPPVFRYRLTKTGRRKAAWFAVKALAKARKRPRQSPQQARSSQRRLIRPNIHSRRVIQPQIYRQAPLEQPEWSDSDEEATRVISPKIHRRRHIRPQIHQIGDENGQNNHGSSLYSGCL